MFFFLNYHSSSLDLELLCLKFQKKTITFCWIIAVFFLGGGHFSLGHGYILCTIVLCWRIMSWAFIQTYFTTCQLFFQRRLRSNLLHRAIVTPLLKISLDKSILSNYRPISNLNSISKLLQRLFLARIQSHILSSPNFINQSEYRRHFSTKQLFCPPPATFFSSLTPASPLFWCL